MSNRGHVTSPPASAAPREPGNGDAIGLQLRPAEPYSRSTHAIVMASDRCGDVSAPGRGNRTACTVDPRDRGLMGGEPATAGRAPTCLGAYRGYSAFSALPDLSLEGFRCRRRHARFVAAERTPK